MAITITVSELLSPLYRMGTSARRKRPKLTRLLSYATEAISNYLGSAYEGTAETIVNRRLAIRLVGLTSLINLTLRAGGRDSRPLWPTLAPGRFCCPTKSTRAGSVAEAASPGSAVRVRWQSSGHRDFHS